MKLINKDAVVAEINKRLEGNRFLSSAEELNYLLCFIDTLEVKEVDSFENDIDDASILDERL